LELIFSLSTAFNKDRRTAANAAKRALFSIVLTLPEWSMLICMLPLCILFLIPSLLAMGQAPERSSSGGADELMRKGITARQSGDFGTAIEAFRGVLAIQPDRSEARIDLGEALAAAGQLDAAIEEDKRALPGAPVKETVRLNLGMAYYKKGDLNDARTEFEAVHVARPLDLSVALLLGYTLNKLDRPAEAVEVLSPLAESNKSNMQLQYVLAYAQIQSGNFSDGLPRMEMVARATNSADAWVMAGSAYLNRGKMHDARVDLEIAAKLNPALPRLNTMIGQACYALGDLPTAVTAFRAALRTDPNDYDANVGLGVLRMKQGDYESAKPLLELALQLQPGMPLARLEMAKLYNVIGKYTEAAAILEDLLKSEPGWLDPHWELATAYLNLNRLEDAKRERATAQQIKHKQQGEGQQNN
jgi:Flp pilus assembly protein TadD